jgi:hypothetical protein
MNAENRWGKLRGGIVATLLLTMCSCASLPQWAPYHDLASLTLGQWLLDIDALQAGIGRHPRLRNDPEAAAGFTEALRELRARLQDTDRAGGRLDAPAVAGIARALAAVGDGHTSLRAYPSEVYGASARWFPRATGGWELRLILTDEANTAWLGGRIVAVRSPDGTDVPVGDGSRLLPNTVHGLVSSVVSREAGLDQDLDALACRTYAPGVLRDPLLTRGLGLADDELVLIFDPQTLPEGTPPLLSLQPKRQGPWAEVLDAAPQVALSRRSREPWWFELDESGILFLQYNRCDIAAEPLLDEVASAVESGAASTLIIDVRSNSGGPSLPGARLAARVARTPLGREPGRLYVLVGPVTFSSGMMNAVDFRASTSAIVAGLPLVEPTSHYGEVIGFTLPESGLAIGHSSRLYRDYGGIADELPRGVLEPLAGWSIEPTFEEYRTGRDPVLEAVLAAAAH